MPRRIGIIQVDGKFPNIALMKIAAWHKANGDSVEWWTQGVNYDLLYASSIFSFSDRTFLPKNAIVGGTGVDLDIKLPIHMEESAFGQSWFLYPGIRYHIGFTQRGCRLKCSFCCVPKKEGRPRPYSAVSELLTNPNGGDRLLLLDNDFFSNPTWMDILADIRARKLKVCFSQGLNIRILTELQAQALAMTSAYNSAFTRKQLTFAWDNVEDGKLVERGFLRCVNAGIKPYKMSFFVLIGYNSTPEEDLFRVEKIRSWGSDPYVMAYDRSIKYQRDFQRWVNHKAIFKTVSFAEYGRTRRIQ